MRESRRDAWREPRASSWSRSSQTPLETRLEHWRRLHDKAAVRGVGEDMEVRKTYRWGTWCSYIKRLSGFRVQSTGTSSKYSFVTLHRAYRPTSFHRLSEALSNCNFTRRNSTSRMEISRHQSIHPTFYPVNGQTLCRCPTRRSSNNGQK